MGGKRVLRLMRREGLLASQRSARRRVERPHVGSIVPKAQPPLGSDATLGCTRTGGWCWLFVWMDHYTAEVWSHVAKVGHRFSALQPVYDAVSDRFGELRACGPGGWRRVTTGAASTAPTLQRIAWLPRDLRRSRLPGEPEGNGCTKQWIRTRKEQCLGARVYEEVDELRQGVAAFTHLYTPSGSSSTTGT